MLPLLLYGNCTLNIASLWRLSFVVRSLTCQGQPVWCQCGEARRWADLWVWSGSLDLLQVLVTSPCPSPFLPVAMTTEAAADCQKTACGLCTLLPRGCSLMKIVPQEVPYSPEGKEKQETKMTVNHWVKFPWNWLIVFSKDRLGGE